MEETAFIVAGGLNTDIIAKGIEDFPTPGGYVIGKELVIGPGGKSRNIAAMIGCLTTSGRTAMLSRTSQDDFGLWKVPLDALHKAGVNTEFVNILPFSQTQKMPAIALIPVSESGENQIFVLPGVSTDFSPEDIDVADALFQQAGVNNGFLILTLECPRQTILHAMQKAAKHNVKIMFDPGGIQTASEVVELLALGTYLIKPNEHETKLITDIEVTDLISARKAADKLQDLGARHVLITHGARGAYLFGDSVEAYLPVEELADSGIVKDATGCGDQTMATLCVYLQAGQSLETAAKTAVVSGTLQFHKSGVQPITGPELAAVGHGL